MFFLIDLIWSFKKIECIIIIQFELIKKIQLINLN